MALNQIPVCPLMSAGNEIPILCVQERCAWYLSNLKKCSMYIQGYKAMVDLKDKKEKHE